VSTSKQELGPQVKRDRITAWCRQHSRKIGGGFEEQIGGGTKLYQRHVLITHP
jgi:hypothetical protein